MKKELIKRLKKFAKMGHDGRFNKEKTQGIIDIEYNIEIESVPMERKFLFLCKKEIVLFLNVVDIKSLTIHILKLFADTIKNKKEIIFCLLLVGNSLD